MNCREQVLEAAETGGKWYDWDELHNLVELPCDLDTTQRACITLARSIVEFDGNILGLVATGAIDEENTSRLNDIIEALQEQTGVFEEGTPSEGGEVLYNLLTDDEKDRLKEYTEKVIKEEVSDE
ncbi:MAG: hypothetical protein GXO26_00700 [Crenarchaeota archaeon]|nr:hypothetical protein [Thermoproteota archaeon]